MLILVIIGIVLKKWGIVSREGQANLMDILIYVVLPCNILSSFLGELSSQILIDSAMVLLVSIVVQLAAYFYGKLIYKKYQADEAMNLRFGLICSNGGYLGNPIAENLFGVTGLLYASIFVIPVRIMMFTQGIAIYTGEKNISTAIKKTITHPCILAVIFGMIIAVSNIPIPEMLLMPIQSLSRCTLALSMMIIGMILSEVKIKSILSKSVIYYTINRLVIIPGIVYIVCTLFQLDELVRNVCVVLTAMPAGAMTSILALKYHRAPEFATKLVLFSTVCSIPVLFIWMLILS